MSGNSSNLTWPDPIPAKNAAPSAVLSMFLGVARLRQEHQTEFEQKNHY